MAEYRHPVYPGIDQFDYNHNELYKLYRLLCERRDGTGTPSVAEKLLIRVEYLENRLKKIEDQLGE